jgi:hypothetical protein
LSDKKTIKEAFDNNSIKIYLVGKENDAYIFYVNLPEGLKLVPPDMREMAYDHESVEEMVKSCVKDNIKIFSHEVINAALFKRVERALGLALLDLKSTIDLVSVECKQADNAKSYFILVSFEHKNGERKCLQLRNEV